MDSVEGHFEVQAADIVRLRLWAMRHNRFLMATVVLAVGCIVWTLYAGHRRGSSYEATLPYVSVLLFWLLFIPLSAWMAGRRYVRQLAPGQERQHFRLSAGGLEVDNAVASARMGWETVLAAYETGHGFYLRHAGAVARALPKRAFAGQPEVEAARRILREGLGSRAHLGAT